MDRNYDLADMLVANQRNVEGDFDVGDGKIEIYFYQGLTSRVKVGSTLTIIGTGPLYYVSPTPSGDEIICGAWAAS